VQHVFAHTELTVERNRRLIFRLGIGLHEDDPGAARGGDFLQRPDQRRGDPLPPVRGRHCQVVDVDFAAFLLELVQFVGAQGAAYGAAVIEGRQRDEAVAAEQFAQVVRARPLARVRGRIAEGFAKEGQQRVHEGGI